MSAPWALPLDRLRFNSEGLIPAIAQDWLDGAVLMLAWMNLEALELTLSSAEVHYWSRSRKQLWHKGATSGHYQQLKGIRYDCDADVLLISINQVGDVACHTGARSCFYDNGPEPTAGGAIGRSAAGRCLHRTDAGDRRAPRPARARQLHQ